FAFGNLRHFLDGERKGSTGLLEIAADFLAFLAALSFEDDACLFQLNSHGIVFDAHFVESQIFRPLIWAIHCALITAVFLFEKVKNEPDLNSTGLKFAFPNFFDAFGFGLCSWGEAESCDFPVPVENNSGIPLGFHELASHIDNIELVRLFQTAAD